MYGFQVIRPEQTVKIYAPPITWRGRLYRLWDAAAQVFYLAMMFMSFAFSFAMIFRMVNGVG